MERANSFCVDPSILLHYPGWTKNILFIVCFGYVIMQKNAAPYIFGEYPRAGMKYAICPCLCKWYKNENIQPNIPVAVNTKMIHFEDNKNCVSMMYDTKNANNKLLTSWLSEPWMRDPVINTHTNLSLTNALPENSSKSACILPSIALWNMMHDVMIRTVANIVVQKKNWCTGQLKVFFWTSNQTTTVFSILYKNINEVFNYFQSRTSIYLSTYT